MNFGDQLLSAAMQCCVVLGIAAIFFAAQLRLKGDGLSERNFLKFVGLEFSREQFDFKFLAVWILSCSFAIIATFLQFKFSSESREMLMSGNSPYGVILKHHAGVDAFMMALIYCFIQAAGSEELLFRGLIARKLFSSIGHLKGNIVQALIFWTVHLVMIWLMTGEWISVVQVWAFIVSFGLGLVLGWINFRRGRGAIIPSWFLHGSVNYFTFVTLATVWHG